MTGFQSRRHTCAGIPSSIHDVLAIVVLCLIEQRLYPRLREAPAACIKRLLLTPNDCSSIRVHIQIRLELGPREGVQLLNTGDGSGLEIVNVGSTMFVKGSVDLTRAQDDTINIFWWCDGVVVFWVRYYPLEMRIPDEIFNRGAGQGMTEERFREEEDEC